MAVCTISGIKEPAMHTWFQFRQADPTMSVCVSSCTQGSVTSLQAANMALCLHPTYAIILLLVVIGRRVLCSLTGQRMR